MNRQEMLEAANGIRAVIIELHEFNMLHLNNVRAQHYDPEVRRRANMVTLQLSFGLAKLAVRAAELEMSAEDAKHAAQFLNVAMFN